MGSSLKVAENAWAESEEKVRELQDELDALRLRQDQSQIHSIARQVDDSERPDQSMTAHPQTGHEDGQFNFDMHEKDILIQQLQKAVKENLATLEQLKKEKKILKQEVKRLRQGTLIAMA